MMESRKLLGIPQMPELNSFSDCLAVLASLRDTAEHIQSSLLHQYSELCNNCDYKLLPDRSSDNSHNLSEKSNDDKPLVEEFGSRVELVNDIHDKEASLNSSPTDNFEEIDIGDGGIQVEDVEFADVDDDPIDKIITPSCHLSPKGKSINGARVKTSGINKDNQDKRKLHVNDPKETKSRRVINGDDLYATDKEEEEHDDQSFVMPAVISGAEHHTDELAELDVSLRKLHREVGNHRFNSLVTKFTLGYKRDQKKEEDGVPLCKSLTCNGGRSCDRQHPLRLQRPGSILKKMLEEEAGRLLVPKWLKLGTKQIKNVASVLRIRRRRMGLRNFQRALLIAEANIKFELQRPYRSVCSLGIHCDAFFCPLNHPDRVSDRKCFEYLIWTFDMHEKGIFSKKVFPDNMGSVFPKSLSMRKHTSYLLSLLRYRRDLTAPIYEKVMKIFDTQLSVEKLRNKMEPICKFNFANCRLREACDFAHMDVLSGFDMKIFIDMLKIEKASMVI